MTMPNLSQRLSERNRQALEAMLVAEADAKQRLAQVEKLGPTALNRLAQVAQGDSGQSHHCRRILLAVYNGPEWPLELTRLRVIDRDLQDAALVVIEWAAYTGRELHEYLDDGNALMRRFWLIETGGED
ncbi:MULTISPECIES: hypothetical protein [unclassified Halomonas]|uniref:DUF7673 family protein n=1 Tax=unclassified Halomonas TaxID=2609666 RepID=UPI00288689C8|nr:MULTISPECIES: hypothetical protein [unclassified Halomonas]MDT0501611.1 hypothetical protein [Halomonas sp. PAR7]MDT0511032.1 hypothetical protein [Halomonas sp. LES1]MDT0592451.1 hypothetical protein [Halomonas sp. PAR8]